MRGIQRHDQFIQDALAALLGDIVSLPEKITEDEIRYDEMPFHHEIIQTERVRTRLLSMIAFLTNSATHSTALFKEARQARSLEKLLGIAMGLEEDYEAGLLDRLTERIEADIVADYLTMAEQLFAGERGPMRHVPAAVLAGAVLEDGLRRLCERQSPPLDINKPNGEPKRLNALIDDLKAAGVYNELKAKQLRAWADIRNAAAHGRFDEFAAADVERMLTGVGDFLADYL